MRFLCSRNRTYIEYQGFWTHHTHPYNPKSTIDIDQLEYWKTRVEKSGMYLDAIHTWTVRDPLKHKIAKENNLNWIEFWNIDEVKKWLNRFEFFQ